MPAKSELRRLRIPGIFNSLVPPFSKFTELLLQVIAFLNNSSQFCFYSSFFNVVLLLSTVTTIQNQLISHDS